MPFGDLGQSNTPTPLPGEDTTAPSLSAPVEDKIKWVDRTIQASRTFLRNQRAYSDIAMGREKIDGPLTGPTPGTLSKVRVNRSKRQIREIVETIASLKHGLAFSTDNKDLYRENQTLDIMAEAWWLNTFADQALKDALQYAGVECMGYLVVDWDDDYWTRGRGEIVAKAMGPESVLPFEIGDDHDLQEAYAVTILRPLPTNTARSKWPKFADQITPDIQPQGLVDKGRNLIQKFASPVLNILGQGVERSQDATGAWPTTTIRYTFIQDSSINRTGAEKTMGTPGSTWEYKVPSVGGDVLQGHDRLGNPVYRKATEEDARLYPFRRLMITAGTVVLFDGSSPHWHGLVPAVPVYFDKWPWDYLPYSLLREVASIDEDNNQILRVINDNMRARARMPLAYDDSELDEATVRRLDTRAEGQRYGYNMTRGELIKPILPPGYYDMPPWILQHIKEQEQRQDYLIGTMDFSALSRLGQMPSGETIEDLMKAVGPLVNGMVRNLERTLRELGEIWKGLALQHYTKPRRVQILSPDLERQLAEEQKAEKEKSRTYFQYSPLHMVPSHMPWEKTKDDSGEDKDSSYTLAQRARQHISSFFFYIKPGTRHLMHEMSKKLLYQTLYRSGFPLDWWTMADMFGIENFGAPPEGTTTVMERWEAGKRMLNEQAMEAQATLLDFQAKLSAAMGAQNVPSGGAGGAGGGAGGPAGQGSGIPGQAGPGRPPSGQEPPKLEQKGDGRSVLSESG